jgi:hypothetical protein
MVFALLEHMKRNPEHEPQAGGESRLQDVTRAAQEARVSAELSFLPGRLVDALMAAIT